MYCRVTARLLNWADSGMEIYQNLVLIKLNDADS